MTGRARKKPGDLAFQLSNSAIQSASGDSGREHERQEGPSSEPERVAGMFCDGQGRPAISEDPVI